MPGAGRPKTPLYAEPSQGWGRQTEKPRSKPGTRLSKRNFITCKPGLRRPADGLPKRMRPASSPCTKACSAGRSRECGVAVHHVGRHPARRQPDDPGAAAGRRVGSAVKRRALDAAGGAFHLRRGFAHAS